MSEQSDGIERRVVFVNCPFDPGYSPLLRCLLFTLVYFGREPAIASAEASAGGRSRIEILRDLVARSAAGIHDISLAEVGRDATRPRFNVAFELGLDLGYRFYGGGAARKKKILILHEDWQRDRDSFSDLLGHDVVSHGREQQRLIQHVREWLAKQESLDDGPQVVFQELNVFLAVLEEKVVAAGFTGAEDLQVAEFVGYAREWLAERIG